MRATTYMIAVNTRIIGKLPPDASTRDWYEVNTGFRNEALTLEQIADMIRRGHAITTPHRENHRKTENFIHAQHLALDFDTGDERSRLETLLADPFIHEYATLLHTTASHTDERPRARVLFILDCPVSDAGEYTRLAKALLANYPAADQSTSDPVRLWFGAAGCRMIFHGRILPLQEAMAMLPAAERPVACGGEPPIPPEQRWSEDNAVVLPQGRRNVGLTSWAGKLRYRGMAKDALFKQLQDINNRYCQPPLTDTELHRIVESVCRYPAGPRPSELRLREAAMQPAGSQPAGQPDTEALFQAALSAAPEQRSAALAALAFALAGADSRTPANPLEIERYAGRAAESGLCSRRAFLSAISHARREAARSGAGRPDHAKLAERWVLAHPLTVYGLGEFRRFADGAWRVVSRGQARQEALQVVKAARQEGVHVTAAVVESVLDLAAGDYSIDEARWDADPDVLPMRNGALRLSTRALRPALPEDYLSACLDYDYDPAAACPTFLHVLHTGLPEAADFFQEFAGYALTGDMRHEIAVWLYGPSGCGKSTLIDGLQAMLGPRAGLLGLDEIERSRFALTGLPGKTLLVAAEQPDEYIQRGHVLNALISGEPLTVDRKYREPVVVRPRAKLLWAMNQLPGVSPESGLFRRVRLLPMAALDETRRDPGIKQAVRAERAGILNWALEGLERLNRRGRFETPEAVAKAMTEFQALNDVPAAFVAERCWRGEKMRTPSSELYRAYSQWCFENGHRPLSSTRAAAEWKRLGFEKRQTGGRKYWLGVGLFSKPEQEIWGD